MGRRAVPPRSLVPGAVLSRVKAKRRCPRSVLRDTSSGPKHRESGRLMFPRRTRAARLFRRLQYYHAAPSLVWTPIGIAGGSRCESSSIRSWRALTVRGLSKSAMRSASMLYPPALMRRNSTEIPERSRTALTRPMARKNHEFTSIKISVRSPRSNGETVSMPSMQHPPRPRSRSPP